MNKTVLQWDAISTFSNLDLWGSIPNAELSLIIDSSFHLFLSLKFVSTCQFICPWISWGIWIFHILAMRKSKAWIMIIPWATFPANPSLRYAKSTLQIQSNILNRPANYSAILQVTKDSSFLQLFQQFGPHNDLVKFTDTCAPLGPQDMGPGTAVHCPSDIREKLNTF